MSKVVFLYEKEIDVKWSDMDALGHVNNARYFSYLEDCRVSWFSSGVLDLASLNEHIGVVLVHVEMDYLKPIVFPANILVRMSGAKPGTSSMQTHYEIVDADSPQLVYAKSLATLVWFDLNTQKSAPVPDAIRQLFST